MKLVNDEPNDWDEHLPAIFFSYRSSIQKTTKLLVSLVGSPCFNIGKTCVSIHLFMQAKVLKMWKTG